jgi:hypothetical protein
MWPRTGHEAGRALGRSWAHFWDEASALEHHYEHPLEARYRDLAREAVELPERPAGQKPSPPSLFDE